jgi:hypothetical protein
MLRLTVEHSAEIKYRYLTPSGLERSLAAGRTVEQWLGVRREGDFCVLKWLSIERDCEGSVTLRVREVLDDGHPGFLDVYEFTPYDAEAEFGTEHTFPTAQDALEYATSSLGADANRFTGEGMVQLEYADYLKTRD